MLFLRYLKAIGYPMPPPAGPEQEHESGYLPLQAHVDPGFPYCAPHASGVLWAKHNLDLPPGFETSDLPKYGS
eukprot:2202758-Alexandrium_andersonii.AAC.1